jgi:DNA-binding transcriptional MerR regulator
MAIDTLKVARRLREAGFNEAQAEAVAVAVQESSEGADLATKGDLNVQRVELRAEIAALRSEMREMETRLIARIEAVKTATETAIEAAKSEILGRMLQMILSAVLVNFVAMASLMFAFAKLLGH